MIYFDLCGMYVDRLRKCYRTKMRLTQNSDVETDVQFYFAAEGAKPYPGYTRFASGTWAYDRWAWSGTGEVLGAPRAIVRGRPPKAGMIGQGFCGRPDVIRNGNSITDTPLPCYPDGRAKCCPGPKLPFGLTMQGPLIVLKRCGIWNDPPNDFAVTFDGGDMFVIGNCTVSNIGACTWQAATSVTPPYHIYTAFRINLQAHPSGWIMQLQGFFVGSWFLIRQWNSAVNPTPAMSSVLYLSVPSSFPNAHVAPLP